MMKDGRWRQRTCTFPFLRSRAPGREPRVVRSATLAAWTLLLLACPAAAHRLKLFASAEGRTIQGRAYFAGGGNARHVAVRIVGPGGKTLGERLTDEEGEFSFEARFRCEHRIVAETTDGHRTEFVLSAEELPEDLPAWGRAEKTPKRPEPAARRGNGETSKSGHRIPDQRTNGPTDQRTDRLRFREPAPTAESTRAVEKAMERVVARHVRPLREQLDAYESQVRLRDVLGGIGYVLGLAGLALYLKTRRPRASGGPGGSEEARR